MWFKLGEPSAETVRIETLSLWRCANSPCSRRAFCGDCACALSFWRRANASSSRRTLYGDPACQNAPAVGDLVCRSALATASCKILCEDPACRNVLAVRPIDFPVLLVCKSVFGSYLVVCAYGFIIAGWLGFYLLGPRQLRLENLNFNYESSMRRANPERRLLYRKF